MKASNILKLALIYYSSKQILVKHWFCFDLPANTEGEQCIKTLRISQAKDNQLFGLLKKLIPAIDLHGQIGFFINTSLYLVPFV